MLCLSVNMKKPKIIIILLLTLILLAGIIFSLSNKSENEIILSDTECRTEFLKLNGCDVSEESEECISVTIPCEFNQIYNEYNEIQISQGFDLSDYRGEKVNIYTYRINQNDDMIAVLMLYGDKLVGCEKHSEELGCQIQPLISANNSVSEKK